MSKDIEYLVVIRLILPFRYKHLRADIALTVLRSDRIIINLYISDIFSGEFNGIVPHPLKFRQPSSLRLHSLIKRRLLV